MKKNVVLTLLVFAIMAVPMFAEPSFSGSFSYGLNYDFEHEEGGKFSEVWEGIDNNIEIDFEATLSDFTSLTASVSGDEDDKVTVGTLVLSQDLTGALGMTGDFGFSYKVGKQTFAPEVYTCLKYPDAEVGNNVTAITYKETVEVDIDGEKHQVVVEKELENPRGGIRGSGEGELGFVGTIALFETINVSVALYPQTYMDEEKKNEEFGVNLHGAFGDLEVSAYYCKSDENPDYVNKFGWQIDYSGNLMGANAKYTFGDAAVSAFVETNNDSKTTWVALAGSYKLNDFTFKAGFDVNGFGKDDFDLKDSTDVDVRVDYDNDALNVGLRFDGSLDDFTAKSWYRARVGYTISDTTVYGQMWVAGLKDVDLKERASYEAGLKHTIDNVTFNAGYVSNNFWTAWKAFDHPCTHPQGVFFNVKASF